MNFKTTTMSTGLVLSFNHYFIIFFCKSFSFFSFFALSQMSLIFISVSRMLHDGPFILSILLFIFCQCHLRSDLSFVKPFFLALHPASVCCFAPIISLSTHLASSFSHLLLLPFFLHMYCHLVFFSSVLFYFLCFPCLFSLLLLNIPSLFL